MKFSVLLLAGAVLALPTATVVNTEAIDYSTITDLPGSEPTDVSDLEKRADPFKRPPKVFSKKTKITKAHVTKPWLLKPTDGGEPMHVTPTVWGDALFRGQRQVGAVPNPWIKLKKDGQAKTITPKVVKGKTKNAPPEYGDWFHVNRDVTENARSAGYKTAHPTDVVGYNEMLDEEDPIEASFNPVERCTPEKFIKVKKQRVGPWCSPQYGKGVMLDHVHWFTWYTREFPDAEKVRLHCAYIQGKALHKREIEDSSVFHITEWVSNTWGVYPMEIEEEWLDGEYEQKVAVAIQPDYMDDDEITDDYLLKNSTFVRFRRGAIVQKKDKGRLDLDKNEEGMMITIITIPSVVVIFACIYVLFTQITAGARAIPKFKNQRRRKDGRQYENIKLQNQRRRLD